MGAVLLVSNSGDIHCDYLIEACERLQVACFRLNTDRFRKYGYLNWYVDNDRCQLEIDGRQCDLEEVGLLIYRRPVPAHQFRRDVEPWVGRLLDAEWTAVENALSRSGQSRIMNPLHGSALAQNKIIQLKAAVSAGLRVPETLISTDAARLQAFARRHRCVTKGIVNAFFIDGDKLRSAFTSLVDETDLFSYDPTGCPTLLQEAIVPQAVWRVVVVGSRVLGFRFHGPELLDEVDSRKVDQIVDGETAPVPEDVARNLLKMCRALNIEFASSDFIEDKSGQMWFLDLNPEGQWAFLEDRFEVRISDEIIRLAIANH